MQFAQNYFYQTYIFFYINKISRSQGTFWYLFFFLSDCGPSTEVANTLYRGGNTNLCVCPRPSSVLELGQGGGGGSKVRYDLMPCVIDDFTKKHQHFIQHGTPPKVLYDLHSGGGGRDSSDFLSLHPNKSYKTSFYKKFIKL